MINNGSQLRDKGINQAINNANNKHNKWSNKAYKFLVNYIKSHHEFMAEDVRVASEEELPKPPSNRAWGGLIIRAVRA